LNLGLLSELLWVFGKLDTLTSFENDNYSQLQNDVYSTSTKLINGFLLQISANVLGIIYTI